MQSLDIRKTHGCFYETVALRGPEYTSKRSFNFPSPAECPHCHKGINPELHHLDVDNSGRNITQDKTSYWAIYALFHCPACSLPFYAEYVVTGNLNAELSNPELRIIGPVKHQDYSFSE